MSLNVEDGPPGPEDGESRGYGRSPANATKQLSGHHTISYRQSSRSVAWYEVHLYVNRMLERLGVHDFPQAGTPEWCALNDSDPVKAVSVLDYGQHHALRVETAQEASCEASQTISAALDWASVAQANRNRAEFCADNPWARRVSAA